MTNERTTGEATIALTRFGLGARPGDRKRIAGDPRGAVEAELLAPDAALLSGDKLRTTGEMYLALTEKEVARRYARGHPMNAGQKQLIETLRKEGRLPAAKGGAEDKGARGAEDMPAREMGGSMAGGPEMAGEAMDGPRSAEGGMAMGGAAPRRAPSREAASPSGDAATDPRPKGAAGGKYSAEQLAYVAEADARFERARAADIGFVERLAAFWANHFAVSALKGYFVLGLAGPFEREAIRPHVLGRFSDMLDAVTRHPAMLWYLDNFSSFGPNSKAGEAKRIGLNENHARELLELHTVGVNGGYSQADVTAFAKALTGWTVNTNAASPDLGAFRFDAARHEPGAQTIMGRKYAGKGVDQAQAVLDDLATNPATASHVAKRLALAFVSDDPPPALVERLAKIFRDSEGDLKEVSLALVSSDEAWAAPRGKMRNPQEFAFASVRAFADRKQKTSLLMRGLTVLGQQFWRPPSPQGYSLVGADWIAPDAQTNRLDLASDLAEQNARDGDPNALAEDLIGDVMTDETRTAVKRAGSREQALALLLMSPEMQRR